MGKKMDRVTLDLVGSTPVMFDARSLKPIRVTFDRILLALAIHALVQFTRIVSKVFVDAAQLPTQKILLPLFHFGELRSQIAEESPPNPVRNRGKIHHRPLRFFRSGLDRAQLLERKLKTAIAFAAGQGKRQTMAAPALVGRLNLTA